MLVDPTDKSVLLFRSGRLVQALRGTDRIDLDDILPELRLSVQELFASLTMA